MTTLNIGGTQSKWCFVKLKLGLFGLKKKTRFIIRLNYNFGLRTWSISKYKIDLILKIEGKNITQ